MRREQQAYPGNESPCPPITGPLDRQLRPRPKRGATRRPSWPAAEECGSKAHLTRTVGGMGPAAAVPPAVMAVYRQMFPGWSTRRIEEDYQKHKE